jgi:hypothetical protein
MGRILLLVALVFTSSAFAGDPPWQGPWKGIPELVPILRSVPQGREVLDKALAKDPAVLKKIKIGQSSYTESTYARTYSLLDGKEKIELLHEITLNRKLPLSDAVVDLAHELVHFTEKEMLDPYKPGFELGQFVRMGIEGQGGELQALERECKVAWALQQEFAHFPSHRLCAPYRLPGDGFNREQARRDYYALGSWYPRASKDLLQAAPLVSRKGVIFTSSYARKPYPIALAEEFASTKEAACANNRKKYRLISSQAEEGRLPASVMVGPLRRERLRLKAYEEKYCRVPKGPSLQHTVP